MTNQPFSNREITAKFENIIEKLDEHTETHTKILEQTTKTNGRVNRLERNMLVVVCVLGTMLIMSGSKFIDLLKTFL